MNKVPHRAPKDTNVNDIIDVIEDGAIMEILRSAGIKGKITAKKVKAAGVVLLQDENEGQGIEAFFQDGRQISQWVKIRLQ